MPTAPKAAKKPQDHKPAKAEGLGEDIVFDFDGDTYSIPRERADNVEMFELIEDGKNFSAARAFLGEEQWKRFKESVRTPDGRVPGEPTDRFLTALMEAVGGN